MEWYLKVVKDNYANFKGRARRKEYWMFVLFNLIFAMVAVILDNVFNFSFELAIYGPIYSLYALAVLIPGLAVLVRRLHDIGKSGWWFFIAFVPFIGSIWLLVLLVSSGESGPNKWGPDPKGNGFEEIDEIGTTEA